MAESEAKIQKITKDMTAEEIFASFPKKAMKFAMMMQQHGLHCVGCSASSFETIEQGMLGHGMNKGQMEQLLEALNEIVEE